MHSIARIRPHCSRFLYFTAAVLLGLIATLTSTAANSTVDSLATLQTAINAAAPGDTITLKDGLYTTTEAITVTCAGTEKRPITISAATIGGVEIAGANGFTIKAPAAHIVISGFRFTHTGGRCTINADAHHIRLTRNTFACSGTGYYLGVRGDDCEIDHNEFRDKKTAGNMIDVAGNAPQVARRLWIHHNYFHDFSKVADSRAGAETIRFGLSGLSMSRGDGLVEHNLFVRCMGENELISNKSCANTYRYNTFFDSKGAQLTIRHGNDCVVYGNYFKRTDGLRIFGDRHLIHSNYFEDNTRGINIGNGGAEIGNGIPGVKLTEHDRPDDCVIVFNTFINNKAHYQMDGRQNGLGATRTTFANNIIQGGETAVSLSGPYPDAVWGNNLLWQIDNAGTIPAKNVMKADPQFVRDANGIQRLQSGSPAINASEVSYSNIKYDMDGQPRRPTKSDLGADEFHPGAPLQAKPLTPSEVGPHAP